MYDETVEFLGPAIERNYTKWGYSFLSENSLIEPQERNPSSYGEAIEQLKDTIRIRGAFMDENIEKIGLTF